ncbi:hypothetical protein PLANTIT3_30043 [Plantibacter sp. T3]|nr:hypothetical protein PLANTIT3_30043 [Plantibacter sp. T3]
MCNARLYTARFTLPSHTETNVLGWRSWVEH